MTTETAALSIEARVALALGWRQTPDGWLQFPPGSVLSQRIYDSAPRITAEVVLEMLREMGYAEIIASPANQQYPASWRCISVVEQGNEVISVESGETYFGTPEAAVAACWLAFKEVGSDVRETLIPGPAESQAG
jgi:hypothetical protein